MPEDELDPAANTQMFQAFMDRREPEATRPPWIGVAVGLAAVVVLLIVAVIAWAMLGG